VVGDEGSQARRKTADCPCRRKTTRHGEEDEGRRGRAIGQPFFSACLYGQ
jgi:hypothetical protein